MDVRRDQIAAPEIFLDERTSEIRPTWRTPERVKNALRCKWRIYAKKAKKLYGLAFGGSITKEEVIEETSGLKPSESKDEQQIKQLDGLWSEAVRGGTANTAAGRFQEEMRPAFARVKDGQENPDNLNDCGQNPGPCPAHPSSNLSGMRGGVGSLLRGLREHLPEEGSGLA